MSRAHPWTPQIAPRSSTVVKLKLRKLSMRQHRPTCREKLFLSSSACLVICQPVRHWISGEPSPPSCEVSLGWRENQQLQAQGDRKMERACSDHVCSSRQSPCMCLLLGHNAYTLGIQKHIMCCLFPEGMKTTMTHKVIHHSNLCGAPHFRNRSDPRFVATKATIVGHLWGTDRPPPWHLRTGPHSKPRIWEHGCTQS